MREGVGGGAKQTSRNGISMRMPPSSPSSPSGKPFTPRPDSHAHRARSSFPTDFPEYPSPSTATLINPAVPPSSNTPPMAAHTPQITPSSPLKRHLAHSFPQPPSSPCPSSPTPPTRDSIAERRLRAVIVMSLACSSVEGARPNLQTLSPPPLLRPDNSSASDARSVPFRVGSSRNGSISGCSSTPDGSRCFGIPILRKCEFSVQCLLFGISIDQMCLRVPGMLSGPREIGAVSKEPSGF